MTTASVCNQQQHLISAVCHFAPLAPLFKKTKKTPNNLAELVKENLLVTDRNSKQIMASENMTKLTVTKAISIETYCGNLKVKNVLTSPVASFCFQINKLKMPCIGLSKR